jgi:hypothetical protein
MARKAFRVRRDRLSDRRRRPYESLGFLALEGGTRLARETRMDVALFLVSRSSGLFLGVGLMWMLRASLSGLTTSQGDFTSTPSGPDSP